MKNKTGKDNNERITDKKAFWIASSIGLSVVLIGLMVAFVGTLQPIQTTGLAVMAESDGIAPPIQTESLGQEEDIKTPLSVQAQETEQMNSEELLSEENEETVKQGVPQEQKKTQEKKKATEEMPPEITSLNS